MLKTIFFIKFLKDITNASKVNKFLNNRNNSSIGLDSYYEFIKNCSFDLLFVVVKTKMCADNR